MADAPLILSVDYMSQPCRSILQLIKVNKLPVQEEMVHIIKGDAYKQPYKSRAPLRKIPTLREGEWVLPESGAILCYLCARFRLSSCTDTDWFKAEDLRQRGSVDAVLHWHHTAIRVPCFAVVFHRWLAPRMGQPADPAAGDKGEADLRLSLKALQRVWLAKAPFLAGEHITIADLQVSAELEGMRVVYGSDLAGSQIFSPFPAVLAWMQRVASHLGSVHGDVNRILDKVVAKQVQQQQQQQSKL